MPASLHPYGNFNFRVEISGIDVGDFNEVIMPNASIEVIEYRNGADLTTRKLPGRVKYSNIVLKRGLTGNTALYQWWRQTETGQIDRRSGSVILLNDAREEVIRWNFFEAWPIRYKFPDLSAEGNQEVVELIEITLERMELA